MKLGTCMDLGAPSTPSPPRPDAPLIRYESNTSSTLIVRLILIYRRTLTSLVYRSNLNFPDLIKAMVRKRPVIIVREYGQQARGTIEASTHVFDAFFSCLLASGSVNSRGCYGKMRK